MILKTYTYTPFKADGKLMFGRTQEEFWNKFYPCNKEGNCTWALRSLLIDDGLNRVLIDTGFNNYDKSIIEEYEIHDFKKARQLIDYKEYVNIVFHTHLHLDHCGGSFLKTNKNFIAAFENACYYVSEDQFYTAGNPSAFERDSFQPEIIEAFKNYKNLKLINSKCKLLPWLELRQFNGHTRGLLIPFIHYKNKIVVFVGDLIPSIAHLELNSISGYDIDPSLSQTERQAFLKEAYLNKYVLFFQHDTEFECCTLDYDGTNYKAFKKFDLLSIDSI